MSEVKGNMRKVICPICGHVFPVRFYIDGLKIQYSVYCNECKKTSIVDTIEIQKNRDAVASVEACK